MLTGNQIRKEFIEFFKNKSHKHFESASLIPDDPTLLLTVAGMVPFKPYFLGQKEAPYPRVTTYQKCIRTNDLENVGRTARHHTFFEMLGNFSFGDYFKEEAIQWSWEFVTEVLKLDKDKLWVSVFTTDDEAEKIWIEKCNFPKERIVRLGEDENWWAAGPTGSCGPCSEIHVDLGPSYGGDENSKLGDEGTDNRFIEIWNLVFTEWNRKEDGSLEPLPKKNIDTGAGLERIAAMVQGKSNNFETDLLFPLVEEAGRLTNSTYGKNKETNFSLKVITDHSRAVTFLINDGVIPSNEGRGYVLRRILRRAVRHGRLLGQSELFLFKMVDKVVAMMGDAYPDLKKNIEHIKKVVKIEEEKFSKTLDQGIQLVNQEIEKAKGEGKNHLSGEVTFKLYDTYGFPYELTEEICEENGVKVSKEEFEAKMEEQKEKARSAREVVMEKGQDSFIEDFYDKHGTTEFVGYESFKEKATLLNVRDGKDGKKLLIFDRTPFYAESGGQTSDHGTIIGNGFEGRVVDVQKQKGIFTHTVEVVKGEAVEGQEYTLEIDAEVRAAMTKNHTATHLLHKALREVLGDHVQQAGSYVNAQRLRFDFNHYEAMTEEELDRVEDLVNEKIAEALEVDIRNMSMDEAKKEGAMALFGDKYGSVVRVVKVGDFSIELCGGTHIDNIGKIGLFKIESESGIAAGVRRIEAVTGKEAYRFVKKMENNLKAIAKTVKADTSAVVERVEKLNETLRENNKEIEALKAKLTSFEAKSLNEDAEEINGVKVVAKTFKDKTAEELRQMVDSLKEKLGSCVVILGSGEDKAIFAVGVTKDLTGKVKAGVLVKEAAQIAGGNGGGRPDFAQAGGKDASKVGEAVAKAKETLKTLL
ncbi:Alanine--tRNA ligase [Fusobacterium sp. DD29]|uniref:alanine--tRNA ligase n=1 Tax=unclassified Fusobacterium TaxID=2648384 RepID=UPI001B8D619E|nr:MULTISPECIES: alanine--tRNA ligase [unclassified Fusobacterium]MBR8749005.1 Alanine--tRNA ligase [Fusobacterium sp. DD29]MBR8761212.1 Alanine--tRNA ligase [Fusobacterium sp. DD25]MBR8767284.1 Alanine--tRNA ligase [Fusobacterium sp. DD43]MBR8771347.1 Alanine--tRNA ligase [Fusobacterium sp. DD40]MBR8775560.1 Alanine--tRNA ligase [Fusobacterium sp. DD17]